MTSYGELRRAAAEFVRAHAGENVVLIGADRAACDEVAQEVCGEVLAGVDRFGLRDFVRRASREAMRRNGLAQVGRVVREAIAARVAAEAELVKLREVAAFPGFPRALTDTLEHLRLNRRHAEGELALLLAGYEREMRERRFADHATRVELACASLRDAGSRFRGAVVLLLDVPARTEAERELLETLKSGAGAVLELSLGAPEADPTTPLEQLQACLFSAGEIPARPAGGSVEVFSTSDEAMECVEIARLISHGGVPFDDTAILLRSPERYQPLVLEGLRRAAIPAYCTRGVSRPDVAGRAFLALLMCAEEVLPASRFAEYLSLGQMRQDEEEWVAPAGWERLLVDAAVIGGKDRWERRLAGLRAEAEALYAKAEDEDVRERLRRRIAQMEALERFALPLIGQLAELPGGASWGEWIAALEDLAENALKSPERVLELLAELEPMGEIGPVGIGQVLLVLTPRLNALRAPEKDGRFGRVWVGGIEEARGMTFRRVFVPGVNEGLFPRPPADDPLLPGEPLGSDHELLRVAAACASEQFTLSFSRLDLMTGRERVPSFFAFEVWRAAGLPELEVREFDARARVSARARIGWPAPEDPTQAIDDAEFDLATLAPLAPGCGLYLKKLPGRAVESLRARWMRWDRRWRAADGLMVEEIGSDAMRPYSLKRRAWPPSMLEEFARCPYRFALRAIHGLREMERPVPIQRMDPATRGMIYHEVQARLLRGTDWLDRLDAVLDEVAAEYAEKLAPAIAQIWRAELQALRADLRGWLQTKLAMEPDWSPVECEQGFEKTLEDGYLLKGRIDLLERHPSGMTRVVDHKTGKPPDKVDGFMVGGGEGLQPALYGMAAEASTGRLWYATIARNYRIIDVPINEWTRRRALNVLGRIDGAIADGFLPAAPRKDGCKGCEYLAVCGPYEEDRVKEKSQVELSGLRELRGWK